MRVGTMFLGRVEPLGHESIQTKFFILGVPIAPLESYYATSEQTNGVSGFPIPLHGMSVIAGYLRIGLFLVALLCGIFGYIEYSRWDPEYGLFGVAVVSTAAWLASMIWLGKLSPDEKLRRSLLQMIAGVGAPPDWLPIDVRAKIRASLIKRWNELYPGTNWQTALKLGTATDALLLIFTIAEYESETKLAQMALDQLKSTPEAAEPVLAGA